MRPVPTASFRARGAAAAAGLWRPSAATIHRAVEAGYKEIAITGVHLGSYGRDLGGAATLDTLVTMLADWPADVLFRLSSLEPMDCTREIVRLVGDSPRLAPHFHLPLQHGADVMLRAMRRPYTADSYRALIDDIHAHVPYASIGTDVIVGFPGETDVDFAATIRLLSALPLSHVHVFPYSDRPGTDAVRLPNRVEGTVVRARAREVREVGGRLSAAFQRSQLGAVRRALTVDDGSRAVTDNYLKLRIAPGHERNHWIDVSIQGAPGALIGGAPPEEE